MRINTTIKVLFSIILLISIFYMIDIDELINLFGNINLKFIFIAILIGFLRTIVGIHRLHYLLKQLFNKVNFLKVISDCLIAGYYNLFLPTALGGDVPKIFLLNKHLFDKKKVIASVFIERFFGFFSLIVLALVSILTLKIEIKNYHTLLISICSFLVLFVFVILFLTKIKIVKTGDDNKHSFISKLKSILESFKSYKTWNICIVFFQSVVYQSLGIFAVYFLGKALGLELSIFPYFVTLPLIWFTIMIPISISGFGLREGAFIYFFKLFGVTEEMALGLSLLFYLQNLIMGSIGGFIMLKTSLSELIIQRGNKT